SEPGAGQTKMTFLLRRTATKWLRLAPNTQLIVKRFAKNEVSLRHVRWYFAMLEERQNPLDPSGTLRGLASFCALRRGALSSRGCQTLGGFGFRGQNRN